MTSTTHAEQIIAYVREQGLQVEWILETHVHADHLTAAQYLKQQIGGKTAMSERISLVQETEPYRVCRRVNILRDYPDDKIKIYP